MLATASISVEASGLKNSFKLCCPFPSAVDAAATEPDFERFKALLELGSADERFLSLDPVVLNAVEHGLALAADGIGSLAAIGLCASTINLFVAEAGDIKGAHRSLLLGDIGAEGLRANMSRMLLRPSNSGISFPDIGSTSLVEYSLCRCPCENMPFGFM